MENPLLELQEYSGLVQALKSGKGPLQVIGTLDSQKAHLIYELGEVNAFAWELVVIYNDTRAKEIYDDLRSFTSQVWLYPAKDLLSYSMDIHGNLMTRQWVAVLRRLMEDREGVAVTTMDGFMDHLLPPKYLREQPITVESGQVIDLDSWKERPVTMGYERMAQVDSMGQFSIRDGIADIFPLTKEVPVRIELWDDEADPIRTFDPESQCSVEQLESVTIYPVAEVAPSGDQLATGARKLEKEEKTYEKALREQHKPEEAHRIHTIIGGLRNGLDEGWRIGGLDAHIRYFCPDAVSFLEYLPQGESAIYLDKSARLKEKGETVELKFREGMVHRLEKGHLLPGQTGLLYPVTKILARMWKPFAVILTGPDQKLPDMKMSQKFSIDAKDVNSYQNSFEILIRDLTRWKKEGHRAILLSPFRIRASRLASNLREYDLRAYCPDARKTDSGNGRGGNTGSSDSGNSVAVNVAANKVRPREILATYDNFHRGFEYPLLKFVFIIEDDMFGVEKKRGRRKKTNYQSKAIQSFTEPSVGDYVVHEEHGLGIYKGIEKVERDKVIEDYIKIEYGDGDNLYLLVTRLENIQRYAEVEAKKPKLNKLGGVEWNKTKTRVRGAIQEIVKDLVKLYVTRQEKAEFQYGPDTVRQREFEELLLYDETDDQMDAIDAVKKDMESRKIMDRPICGGVGYGKTRAALRAAFKAVQDSKQTVYLAPTTILARQHYDTFVQRMKDFPVRVDMLSRFYTPARQRRTLGDLRKGMADIVIGTRRILPKDMQLKDLGLLTIDEEQRFDVVHKEEIEHLKGNVDVLTLITTPVPRALYMSLAGIRDMSVLEESPMDRIPIQTYVMEHNEEMVREAINREPARNGQVYYVCNRVTDIDEVAGHVQTLVPDAVVTFAHGQMREYKLGRTTVDFINGEIDVLVSTTIIETGLDIPNANTMIIHDVDYIGLSQLYQLRGRVGRPNRTSYVSLMHKRDELSREEAEKRFQAIREFTELGSGIKIVMRDLEIRDADNVLGTEQYGHMEAVGYDLYCKMLNQAVLAPRGETLEEDSYETVVECDIDMYIPRRYIKNEYQKLDIYKRISAIETEEEYMDMQDELMDRSGDIPHSVENLFKIVAVRALTHRAYVMETVISRQEVRLTMHQKAKLQVEKIPDLVRSYRGDLKLVPGDVPSFYYVDRKNKNQDSPEMMEKVEEILKDMCRICI